MRHPVPGFLDDRSLDFRRGSRRNSSCGREGKSGMDARVARSVVGPDHHVRSLDDGVGRHPGPQTQPLGGCLRDDRCELDPSATSMTTSVCTAPGVTDLTVPKMVLHALIFIVVATPRRFGVLGVAHGPLRSLALRSSMVACVRVNHEREQNPDVSSTRLLLALTCMAMPACMRPEPATASRRRRRTSRAVRAAIGSSTSWLRLRVCSPTSACSTCAFGPMAIGPCVPRAGPVRRTARWDRCGSRAWWHSRIRSPHGGS